MLSAPPDNLIPLPELFTSNLYVGAVKPIPTFPSTINPLVGTCLSAYVPCVPIATPPTIPSLVEEWGEVVPIPTISDTVESLTIVPSSVHPPADATDAHPQFV